MIWMTEGDIKSDYRTAKDKPMQIKILADVNGCSATDIELILGLEKSEIPGVDGTKYPIHVINEILRYSESDLSMSQISKVTNVNYRVIQRIYTHYGMTWRTKAQIKCDSERTKNTVIEHHLNGCSIEHIVKITGVTYNSVKKILSIYRKTLRGQHATDTQNNKTQSISREQRYAVNS